MKQETSGIKNQKKLGKCGKRSLKVNTHVHFSVVISLEDGLGLGLIIPES